MKKLAASVSQDDLTYLMFSHNLQCPHNLDLVWLPSKSWSRCQFWALAQGFAGLLAFWAGEEWNALVMSKGIGKGTLDSILLFFAFMKRDGRLGLSPKKEVTL